jgi:hypothetical protein
MAWFLCPKTKLYKNKKCKYCYATCDSKIFKATGGGHQLAKENT